MLRYRFGASPDMTGCLGALIPPSVASVCFKSLDGVVPPKNLWFLLVDVGF